MTKGVGGAGTSLGRWMLPCPAFLLGFRGFPGSPPRCALVQRLVYGAGFSVCGPHCCPVFPERMVPTCHMCVTWFRHVTCVMGLCAYGSRTCDGAVCVWLLHGLLDL